jgi:Rne/Rng family ribonuclease
LMPKDAGGVIVRTVAEDITQDDLKRELKSLLALWKKIKRKAHFVRPPALVQREASLTSGIIRDLFSEKVDRLTVDTADLHAEIRRYLEEVDPELIDRLTLYKGNVPLFDKVEIEGEIANLYKRRVDLPTGGYVIIEHTEALVSIDVNTGRYTGKKDPEKTIFRTNQEAAREIARQLRLRDIGGIIVIDFIDMDMQSNRDKVLQELRTHLGRDRARTRLPSRGRRGASGTHAPTRGPRQQGTAGGNPAAPGGGALPPGAGTQLPEEPAEDPEAGRRDPRRSHDRCGRVPARQPAGGAGRDGEVSGGLTLPPPTPRR